MYGSDFHGSNYYASLYYAALRGDEDALAAFNKLSTRDVQYEALKLVSVRPLDTRSMERDYWLGLLGGSSNWSTLDIMHEGIIKTLGHATLKDYYDNTTGTVWSDHNSSEKAYWLKIIAENV